MNKSLYLLGLFFLSGALITTGSAVASKLPGVGIAPRGSSLTSFSASASSSQGSAVPCGGKIAFSSSRDFNGNGEIYVMNDDGTNQTRLTNHSAIDLAPSWSPDGSMMAFQSDRDSLGNGRSDIYVMDADGGNVRRLTTDPAFDESPAWSPDGNRIAFLSTRDDPNHNARHLYVMNADGGGQTRLTFGSSIQPILTWSPDSSTIAFAAFPGTEPGLDIFTINADGGSAHRLPPEANNDIQPAWSPDGTQIAFAHFRDLPSEHSEIYVMNADGSDRKALTNNQVDDTEPSWSPDGSAIAFVSIADSGSQDIYLMYPDGSGRTNLTNSAGSDFSPAWQPTQSGAPCLLTESGTERAVALDSVTFTRDPFAVTTAHNFSPDQRTRVMLFAKNVRLLPGEDMSAVTAEAEDEQGRVIPLTVEFVGQVPNFQWLTQVNVKLTDELQDAGDVRVSISLHGMESNKALISIAPGDSAP